MKPSRSDAMGGRKPDQPGPTRERLQSVNPDAVASTGESPVRALQNVLASRISDGFALAAEEHVERWPRHHRLLFIAGSAMALWGMTIGIAALATAIIS